MTCGVWVGYDSRESLGEKETGAKAALPIWMAVMKTAIAGKDDEQFLGDAENDATRKAEATAPVKPGAKSPAPGTPLPAKANSASGNGAGAKPLKAALVVKGSAAPGRDSCSSNASSVHEGRQAHGPACTGGSATARETCAATRAGNATRRTEGEAGAIAEFVNTTVSAEDSLRSFPAYLLRI